MDLVPVAVHATIHKPNIATASDQGAPIAISIVRSLDVVTEGVMRESLAELDEVSCELERLCKDIVWDVLTLSRFFLMDRVNG